MMADEKTTAAAEARAETAVPDPAATDPPGAGPLPAEGAADQPAAAAEAAEAKEKLLRTLAEMENLRRRTEREISDTRQYAIANFAREMLAVADNLRRAIEAVPKELRDGGDKALAALIEGVKVTEKGLEQSLTKFGVRRIAAKGEKFDASVHQAMFEVETDAVAPGSVAEEMQAGYVIGERVLRPALVTIAKKAAKPETTTAAASGETAVAEAAATPADRELG